ncbi:MAG: hypothetical protein FWB86_06265 [Treponema sp.]|nr:hypothetical protein [Treponema sp.]MCL2251851.1 hypothetical protein [Treponema sp.]
MPTDAAERKVIYRSRKKDGCCPRCGVKKKKSDKFIYCGDCRAFYRGYNQEMSDDINTIRKERYKKRKKNKQCPRCGKKHSKSYKKIICASCLKKQYSYL